MISFMDKTKYDGQKNQAPKQRHQHCVLGANVGTKKIVVFSWFYFLDRRESKGRGNLGHLFSRSFNPNVEYLERNIMKGTFSYRTVLDIN